MDALELKDTTHFLGDFGDIHHGIWSHSSPAPLSKNRYRKKISRFSMINFPIFNEK